MGVRCVVKTALEEKGGVADCLHSIQNFSASAFRYANCSLFLKLRNVPAIEWNDRARARRRIIGARTGGICVSICLILLCASLAQGSPPSPAAVSESKSATIEAPAGRSPDRPLSLHSRTLTGDWEGRRVALERRGVTVNVYLNNQFHSVVKGGLDTNGSGRNSASMDAFVTADLGKLGLLDDADVLLHLQSNWGAGVNSRMGALYDVNDDADGDLGLHVAQLWYRQWFWQRKLSLTLGFLDFQTIIDRNAFANSEDKQFWNQSLDNNPLVPLNIGLGASATFAPVKWWSLIVGVGDAQSVLYKPGFSTAFHDESWFVAYVENGFHVAIPTPRGPCAGNYRVGVVYDPRVRNVFPRSERDARRDGHDYGAYVSGDQMIFREGSKDEQGLGVFGRFGFRDAETNRVARFWSAGLMYRGLVPGRDEDVLGFGFSLARGGEEYRARVNRAFDNESVYELFYAVQVAPWLVVTPDVQYVDNPGAAGATGHAVAAGVRVRVTF